MTNNASLDVGQTSIDAVGGRGGNGGRPGDLVSTTGGSGGAGGRAEVRADVVGSRVVANATGGAGGIGFGVGRSGGAGGDATADILRITDLFRGPVTLMGGAGGEGQLGAGGGDGGNAGLIAPRPGSSDPIVAPGVVRVTETISAIGGVGGLASAASAAGRGGDASLSVDRIAGAGGSYEIDLESVGGRGGNARAGASGQGGSADARASVEIGGDATASVKSTGGAGGRRTNPGAQADDLDSAAGGVAMGSAVAVSTLETGNANATVRLFGGDGGGAIGTDRKGAAGQTGIGTAEARTGPSGIARATVEVHGGTGGVGVGSAAGGHGGDVTLFNTVSGVGGRVELRQSAFGGLGGEGSAPASSGPSGGRGGDAVSILDQENRYGSLFVDSRATAGSGGGRGGLVGHATAGGSAVALTTATVFAKAVGGTAGGLPDGIRGGADGGEASLAPIRGEAELGVDLIGWVEGGSGISGQFGSGRGADARIVDAVAAITSGGFRATQIAIAGNAGDFGVPSQAETGALGGNATNRLTLDEHVRVLSANLFSQGGRSTGRDAALVGRTGGRADVELSATNHAGGIDSGYGAVGGVGSTAGGAGGDARSIVRLTTEGDDHAIRIVGLPVVDDTYFSNGSIGGRGGDAAYLYPPDRPGGWDGGRGGDGRAEVEGRALGDSRVEVRADSTGGDGGTSIMGSVLGDGGNASSVARGSNAGTSAVSVIAYAQGGNGGRWLSGDPSRNMVGGDGGSAEAEAYGESSGAATVDVVANAVGGDAWHGRAGSVRLVDAVAGRTIGRLALYQSARGGDSVFGFGGDAESTLSQRNESGGALELSTVAYGGKGRAGGGNAVAAASGIGQGDVSVAASAVAGAGAVSGRARLGPVYGESLGGGSVAVGGVIVSASGAAVATDSRTASSDFALDAIIDNGVDGLTTGTLALTQGASGGNATADATGTGSIVRAGSAFNRLDRIVSAEHFEVTLGSAGGSDARSFEQALSPIDGGDASTVARVVNESGGVVFRGSAQGGQAGFRRSTSRGGDASLDAVIETRGAASDILIDAPSVRGGDAYAYGYSTSGIAGSATSRSLGRAWGDSAVEVFDRAVGGQGRESGNASSFARGENAGSQSVHVVSTAEAGRIVDYSGAQNRGIAHSEAHGFSPSGAVDSESRASTDPTSPGRYLVPDLWTGGLADAVATADGSASRVRADSLCIAGAVGEMAVVARASAQGVGSGAIAARAVTGSEAPLATVESGVSVSVASSGVHGRSGEWGRGEIDIRSDRAGPDIVLGGELGFDHDVEANPSSALFVSFLALDLDDDDFATLVFRVSEGDQELLGRSFEDASSARAFFSTPLSIAELLVGLPSNFRYTAELVIAIEGRGVSAGTDFRLAMAVGHGIVPEPGVAFMILLGLAILSSRRSYGESGR